MKRTSKPHSPAQETGDEPDFSDLGRFLETSAENAPCAIQTNKSCTIPL